MLEKLPRWQDRTYRIAPVEQFSEGPGCRVDSSATRCKDQVAKEDCQSSYIHVGKTAQVAELVDALG